MGQCASRPAVAEEGPPEVKEAAQVIESRENGQATVNSAASAPEAAPEAERDVPDFIPPPMPANEEQRVKLLQALNILDSDEEERFSSITKLRQWFKAAEGLEGVCQTGRDVSFCGHTILPAVPQVLVIEDALEDVRFSGNPLVTGPLGIRFYAGAPLISSANGFRYGSLCIIDQKPHKDFTAEQFNMLAQFAELTVREIEKDKLELLQKMVAEQKLVRSSHSGSLISHDSLRSSSSRERERELPPETPFWGLSRAADCFVEGVMLVDVTTPSWQILYTNMAFSTALGVPRDEATSQGFWDMFQGPGMGPEAFLASLLASEPFSITVSLQSIYRQTPKAVTIDFRPTSTTQLGVAVGVPATTNNGRQSPPSSDAAASGRPLSSSNGTGALVDNAAIADNNDINNRSSSPGATCTASTTTASASAGPACNTHRFFFAIVQPGQLRPGAVRPVSDGGRRFGLVSSPSMSGNGSSSFNTRHSGGSGVPALSKAAPTAFQDVRLGPLIGRGAYGRVYRASWNGNTVAVKVMESTCTAAPEDAYGQAMDDVEDSEGPRGIFEAVLSSSLSHPNVVHTYQYAVRPVSKPVGNGGSGGRGTDDSSTQRLQRLSEVWLISEFCNRGPLLTAIERGAFLTQPSAQYGQPNLIAVLQTLQEVAAAMYYLHSNDIVHGDLTGGNVLLTSSDKDARGFSAKVVDFGLSRVCGEKGFLQTKTMGCAEYMPPELITSGILTKAGDVYAFGIVVWEMYVGRRAWEGLQPGQVLKKVASNEMLQFPPQTPHRLKVLGERCMTMQATARPTFAEVLSEVNAILGDTMSILQQFLHATGNG